MHRTRSILIATLLQLSVLHAAGTPTQLSIAAGDGQTSTAGTTVRSVVCVIVRDATNNGVPGVQVTWGSITGGGSITGATQTTGFDGVATLGSWTLGPVPGANSITCTSTGLSSVTFNATGVDGVTHLIIAAGDQQVAEVGAPVSGPVSAQALDAQNNPIGGVQVSWTLPSNGSTLTGPVQITNSNGVATLGGWTLGTTPGTNTVMVSTLGINSLTFTATGVVDLSTVSIAAGNNQFANAGAGVPGVVCVLVQDSNQQPVAGATVVWGAVTGGGTLTGAQQVTGANGLAVLGGWTLGTAPGVNTTTASVVGLNSVTFTATGQAVNANDNAVLRWDAVLLQQIQNTLLPPSIASRAIGEVHTAIFDAWAAYDPVAVGTQLGGTLRRPAVEQTDANKQMALSYAAYRTLLDLFPSQQPAFDALMAEYGYDPTNTTSDTTTPQGIGNAAAAAILTFRHADESNQLGDLNPGPYSDYTTSGYSAYMPVNDPNTLGKPSNWQPLLNADGTTQTFVTPQWGRVTPFAIGAQSKRKLLPKPCATYPSKNYQKEVDAVVALSANLDDTSKSIAAYWADGAGSVTPAGHWMQFGQFVSRRDSHKLDADVQLFFMLGNAMLDAGIACWDCKRHYNAVRPVSAVRFADKGKVIRAWNGPNLGPGTFDGSLFQAYLPTPPSPEYVSDASTFSAAGGAILTTFTKNKAFSNMTTVPAFSSPIESSVPSKDVQLTWPKFSDAVTQAGLAGQYGGIHFTTGDLNGQALGKKVATLVYKKALSYITGKAK